MSQANAASADNLVYLQRVVVPKICFLQEVLYWVAFTRLPVSGVWPNDYDNRDELIEGYKIDVPYRNGELTSEECESARLPTDPRLNYDWAWDVMLDDDLETIVASRELLEDEPQEDKSTRKERVQSDAHTLFKELSEWRPKYERAIEPAAAKVYLALWEGLLTSEGVRLPDPDVAKTLKMLAEQGKKVGELEIVAIPQGIWSQRNIYWEISAVRNDHEHYCHIYCPTEEVLRLFPRDTVAAGEPVEGLMRYGSFFLLPSSAAVSSAKPKRRSKSSRGPGGRPRKFPWEKLAVEMAVLAQKGALPPKKEAGVQLLRDFCEKRGLPVPAISTTREWLTPYYDQLKRD